MCCTPLTNCAVDPMLQSPPLPSINVIMNLLHLPLAILLLFCYSKYIRTNAGPIQNPRLCITYDSKFDMQTYIYHWEIYYKVVATGSYTGISDIIEYLEQLLPSSGYVVCPGLKEYPEQVRFRTKHRERWGFIGATPTELERIQSYC